MPSSQQRQGNSSYYYYYWWNYYFNFEIWNNFYSEEQEQICRDLIQALSTPRPASRGHLGGVFSPEASVANSNDIDASKEEVFQSVLSRLRSMLTTTEE